jgi:hypothetical protein
LVAVLSLADDGTLLIAALPAAPMVPVLALPAVSVLLPVAAVPAELVDDVFGPVIVVVVLLVVRSVPAPSLLPHAPSVSAAAAASSRTDDRPSVRVLISSAPCGFQGESR